jgi:hypothetical protein
MQFYSRWTEFLGTLRKKWVAFSDDIVLALAEEEIRIRREQMRDDSLGPYPRD